MPYIDGVSDNNFSKLRRSRKNPIFITKAMMLLIIPIIIFRCSTTGEKNLPEGCSKIRSVNIGIIFNFMVNSDPKAKALKEQKTHLLDAKRIIDNRLSILKEGKEQEVIIEKREKYNSELRKIQDKEDSYKRKILHEIDRAVGAIAGKRKIDFIFNIGEGAVFSKKEYDITEDVIREIVKYKKRNAPVSR